MMWTSVAWRSAPAVAILACGRGGASATTAAPAPAPSFDLVASSCDDNGFLLDPRWRAQVENEGSLGNGQTVCPDPQACSWRFIDAGARDPSDHREPCNGKLVDPDFSERPETELGFTCLDSRLNMRGHINWGDYWGGAATFVGPIRWEEYSGPSVSVGEGSLIAFGDGDFNFSLTPRNGAVLTPASEGVIGLEYLSGEVTGFGSPWWQAFNQAAFADRGSPGGAAKLVGGGIGVATGLLDLDAEHDAHVELHPVFALALDVPCPPGAGPCDGHDDQWALFVRDRGTEGECSRHSHAMDVKADTYTFRLPAHVRDTSPGAPPFSVAIVPSAAQFCSSDSLDNGKGVGKVSIRWDADHLDLGIVVSVQLPHRDPGTAASAPQAFVDGEFRLHWTGDGPSPAWPAASCTEVTKPDRNSTPKEVETSEAQAALHELKTSSADEYKELVGLTCSPTCLGVEWDAKPGKVDPGGPSSGGCEPQATPRRTTIEPVVSPPKTPVEIFCAKKRTSAAAIKLCSKLSAK